MWWYCCPKGRPSTKWFLPVLILPGYKLMTLRADKCGVDSLSFKRHGSKGENVKMYANRDKICLEDSCWLSKSLTRNQSSGVTSCREKVAGGGDHYLGFRESSFVWHLSLKTRSSKRTAANSTKLLEKEVAWLLTQCSLMSISLCLSAGSWCYIEWEGSCCLFI